MAIAGFLLVLFGSGCGTLYNRHWQAASEQPLEGIEGRWEGRWLSDKNGHNGKLRCVVTHVDGNEYEFHYWATFWKIFSAAYRVEFEVVEENDRYIFSGEKNLGWIVGGVYTYEGEATDRNFAATYKCRIDHGAFHMARPEAPGRQ